jgi:cytochrome P450
MATALVNQANQRKNPPGPRRRNFFGSLQDVRTDPLRLYMEATQAFGDVVRFRSLPTIHWYLLNNPEDVEYVLQKNSQNYARDIFSTRAFQPLIGEGLLISTGDFWRRQRRLAQPAFHRPRLAALASTMAGAAASMAERWGVQAKSAEPFDVAAEMMRLTLQIVGLALFSTDLSRAADTVRRALKTSFEHVNFRLTHVPILPDWFPTARNRRFQEARRELDEVVHSIIEERRRKGVDAGDLLSMLMLARDEETGEGMSDLQLRDEIITLLIAGHETGATALAWTWYLLAQNSEAESSLHDELKEVLGGRTPGFEDLPRLAYTRMVIDEALRLYPPAWGMARQAANEDEIRGYHIPAKALVVFSQYVIQRDPRFWENPSAFEPERFSQEHTAARPRYSYFPFGGGPRVCIGNNFAMMEMQLILATLAQRFSLRLVAEHPVEPVPLVTLRPRNGIQVTVHEHSAS